MTPIRNDPAETERALNLLFIPGQVIEIRALNVASGSYSDTHAGYFNDFCKAAQEAAKIVTAEGVYFTINQVDPALLARKCNRIGKIGKADPTTADSNILQRRLLPIDVDPVRAAKISSTDAEHKAAIDKAKEVVSWLSRRGWPDPMLIDSGNGAQAWYRIDVPTHDDGLIKSILAALAFTFDDGHTKIDQTMHNPARITKLPGTWARKGDNVPDRPYRMARIVSTPNALEVVPADKLRGLAALLPRTVESDETTRRNGKPFELASFIRDHQLNVGAARDWESEHGKATRYIFNVCPWNDSHTDQSAYILQWPDGAISAGCHHDGCSGKDWAALRELYEPGYKDRQNGQHSQPGEETTTTTTTKRKRAYTPSWKYLEALGELGYSFRLNELTQDIEVNGAALSDNLAAEIRVKMRDRKFDGMTAMEDVYTAHALQHAYHPIKDYLNGLKWDGDDHIGLLAVHLEDNHAPFDNGDTVAARYLRRWLVGSVGKVFDQIQLPMLVLEGPQRLGKSRLAGWLASPLPAYYVEGAIDPDNKDSQIRLMSRWIWEVSELGATTRRADVEALKSFITLCDVSVRKPYGRRDVQGPAVCSLIGTLNDTGAGFLNDPTGTRRALTISLARIDWSYTDRVDVNQVWAQAVSLYRAGESPYLLADERETQAKINAEFETVDPVDDVLATELEINPKQFDWVTPSAEVLRIVDERLKGTSAQHARSIAAALKKRGIEAARPYINGAQVRGYRGIRLRKIDELARLQDATRRQVST